MFKRYMPLERLQPFSPVEMSLTASLLSARKHHREAGKRKLQRTTNLANQSVDTPLENLLHTIHVLRKGSPAGLPVSEDIHSQIDFVLTNRKILHLSRTLFSFLFHRGYSFVIAIRET